MTAARRRLGPVVGSLAAVVVVAAGCAAGDVGEDAAGGDATAAAAAVATGDDCPPASSDARFDRATGLGALPAWSFSDLDDPGDVVCTADWEGTPTVVNFWATWCGFCIEEMPDLQAASEALGDRVRFVGVDVQDNRDDALALVAETGVTYDNVADPRQQDGFYGALGNRGMPTTLFVDPQGTVVWRHTGPLDEQTVLDLVAEHLDVTA
jgi:thiol-disulfide isomerase/thioredoxin